MGPVQHVAMRSHGLAGELIAVQHKVGIAAAAERAIGIFAHLGTRMVLTLIDILTTPAVRGQLVTVQASALGSAGRSIAKVVAFVFITGRSAIIRLIRIIRTIGDIIADLRDVDALAREAVEHVRGAHNRKVARCNGRGSFVVTIQLIRLVRAIVFLIADKVLGNAFPTHLALELIL